MTQLLKQQDGVWQITDSQPTDWSAAESFSTGSALKLAVDVEPKTAWASASLIAVDFPALTDGRGLSLAALLRQRIGYAGDLRAVGAVHEDLLHFLLRCGFSSFELPAERDPAIALQLLAPYSNFYQGSVMDPLPALLR